MKNFCFAASLIFFLLLFPLGGQPGSARGMVSTPQADPDLWLSTQLKAHSPAYSGCGDIIAPIINAEYEQRVVDLVNQARAEIDLPPLKRTESLDQAARYQTTDMGQDNYFDHDTYDRVAGELVYVCNTWERIATYYSGANAENAGAGYETPEAVMAGWMDSQGHRDNILNDYSREIGVGYFAGSGDFYHYWIQDFGTRSDVYPLVINREAAATDSRSVSLYIYGEGMWQEMRLRNDAGAWGDWQPFTNEFPWTIAGGVGIHTVSAELRSLAGHVGARSHLGGEAAHGLVDAKAPVVEEQPSQGREQGLVHDLTSAGSPPGLGNLPDSLAFTYSIPDQELLPASQQVTPLNVGNEDPLSWEVTAQGTFFTVEPLQGTTPESITITPTDFDRDKPNIYTSTITITVVNPAGTASSPHIITLTLRVVDTQIFQTYLPGVQNRQSQMEANSAGKNNE